MKRNYIIEIDDGGIAPEKNPVVTEEVATYFAKQRNTEGKSDWANSEVSRRPACKHCGGTGVLSHDLGSRIVGVEPALNKRGNPRRDGRVRFVREPKGTYKQACVCSQRKMDKLDNLNIDDLVLGNFD